MTRRLSPSLRWAILFGGIIAAWLCFWIGFRPSANVMHRYNDKFEPTSWVWVDAKTGSSLGRFEGLLRLPDSRRLWIEDSLGAQVTLTVNQVEIYHADSSGWATLPPDAPAVAPFALDYSVQTTASPRSMLGLYDDGIFGLRYPVPAWQYAPTLTSDDTIPHLARIGFALLALILLIGLASQIRLSRGMLLALIAVLALALIARWVTLDQKFAHDPTLWSMEKVWDNYVIMGRNWLAGRFPVGGNEYQQGMFIYLGMLQTLIGPSIETLYLVHAVIGSLVAGFALITGWLLFDRYVGLLAGVFAALYAPLIHYQQTLQDTAPVILLVSAALLALALYYRRGNGYWVLISALLLGLGAAFRSTVLILLLAVFVAVLLREPRWRQRIAYVVLAGITALLCLLPITAANLVAGVPTLTANLMDYQLFRSNNLDSVGLNTAFTQSEALATLRGDTWRAALLREIERRPEHLVELTARRIALFFDPVEHSDSGMVDYVSTGLDVSPLLNTLALGGAINGRLLMILALIGVSVALIDPVRRKSVLILVAALGAFMLSLAGFYVIGRVRMPISVIALLLAAVAVREVVALIHQRRRQQIIFGAACLIAVGLGYGFSALVIVSAAPDLRRAAARRSGRRAGHFRRSDSAAWLRSLRQRLSAGRLPDHRTVLAGAPSSGSG